MPIAGLRSAPTTTRCRQRTGPATSLRARTRRRQALPTRALRLRPPGSQRRLSGQTSTSPGAPPPTTWALRATTSTGARARALPPLLANRIAQPVTTLYSDLGLAAGTYYYKLTAEDGAGNVSGLSNEASALIPDTTPPSTPTLSATGGAGQASLSWTAATDNVGVTPLRPLPLDHVGLYPLCCKQDRPADRALLHRRGPGRRYLLLQAAGRGRGRQPEPRPPTRPGAVTSAAPSGLVAAYGFDEGSGTTAADRSGQRQHGHALECDLATSGKFGNALSFNGTNARVNVNDSSSLDLTTGMTLEAWVRPTSRAGLPDGRPQGADRATSSTGSTRTPTPVGPTREAHQRRSRAGR